MVMPDGEGGRWWSMMMVMEQLEVDK